VEQGATSLSPDLAGKVEFMPHDFFEPQPVEGADVYMMRHICHNWSVENCTKILRQVVPVMKPQSRILLIEVVVNPSGMEESAVAERYTR
jgi:chemotaxis methyl-accepting protein methylase